MPRIIRVALMENMAENALFGLITKLTMISVRLPVLSETSTLFRGKITAIRTKTPFASKFETASKTVYVLRLSGSTTSETAGLGRPSAVLLHPTFSVRAYA